MPKSPAHALAEAKLQAQTGVAVTDVAFPSLHKLTPAFVDAVSASVIPGTVLVASHPFTWNALRRADRGLRCWYDAHNVELDLKSMMLPDNRAGRHLRDETRDIERACCDGADLVIAACAEDRERLLELYPARADRMCVVPNGVDTKSIRFVAPSERAALRRRLRMTEPVALFIGSWHEPNVVAARHIIALAQDFPAVRFALVGSVGIPLAGDARPANVVLFGTVSDELKDGLLSVANVALNPMLHGSGTNMKMLDYLAAGVPVISTPVGARGLGQAVTGDLRIAAAEDFACALREVLGEPLDRADVRAAFMRRVVESTFDWSVVSDRLAGALAQAGCGSPLATAVDSAMSA